MTTPPTPAIAVDDDGPVILRNPAAAADAPHAPRRPDGTQWRFEMIHAGGSLRTYAQTPAALVEALIPGYRAITTPTEAAAARIRLACDLQVRRQAELATAPQLAECTPDQRDLLLGDFSRPPVLDRWDGPIPLILVTTFYTPVGRITAPQGRDIWWLDPGEDWELLVSLAQAGIITLASSRPAGAGAPEDDDGLG
jgi:hypothetical protein